MNITGFYIHLGSEETSGWEGILVSFLYSASLQFLQLHCSWVTLQHKNWKCWKHVWMSTPYFHNRCQKYFIFPSRTDIKVSFSTLQHPKSLMLSSWVSSASTWSRWWWKPMSKVKRRQTSSAKSIYSSSPSSLQNVCWNCWLWGSTISQMPGTYLI